MINFKEIAEKCLAGELSGTFKLASGQLISSDNLKRRKYIDPNHLYQYEIYVDGISFLYTIYGTLYSLRGNSLDIIDFISNNMQKQIKIDTPEGKVPVIEQTEKGVVITWKEKEYSYSDIVERLQEDLYNSYIVGGFAAAMNSGSSDTNIFYKKVEVLRKLVNIRNYFGGDKPTNSWIITIDSSLRPFVIKNPVPYRESCFIYFDTKEHAEQAIKMLGDELKYLFKPW